MRLVEVVGLTKRYDGVTALDAVSFTVEEGRILGLVGPNGAGKTTVVDCISGFAAPDGGRVIFDGRDVTGQPPHRLARLGIARTFQVARPFAALSAADNVAVALGHGARGRRGARWRSRPSRREVLAVLERVALGAAADLRADTLGPGGLKRLELARALALHPRLVLLEEAFRGLAAGEIRDAAALVEDLRADGVTVVLVEHGVRHALALADRAVVLGHGRVIAWGAPDRVQRDPRIAGTYLGAIDPGAPVDREAHTARAGQASV